MAEERAKRKAEPELPAIDWSAVEPVATFLANAIAGGLAWDVIKAGARRALTMLGARRRAALEAAAKQEVKALVPGKARRQYEQALPLYREIKERLGEASSLRGLGLLALSEGRPYDAFRELQAGIAASTAIDDRLGQQACLGYMARVAVTVGAADHALLLSEMSLELGEQASDRFGMSINLALQWQVFGAIGRHYVALAAAVVLAPLLRVTQQHAKAEDLERQLAPLLAEFHEDRRTFSEMAAAIRLRAIEDARRRLADAGLDPFELPAPR